MKQAYLHYIKHALEAGHTISVFVEGEYHLKRSTSYKAVKDEVEAWDDLPELVVRDGASKEIIGVAVVNLYDKADEPEGSIMDYTMSEYNNAWNKKYEAKNKE